MQSNWRKSPSSPAPILSVAGTFTYDRFDGAAVTVPYETIAPIQVRGNIGEQVTVRLGDSHDPNLAPIATYFFNQIDENTLEEDGGRFPLKGLQVSQQKSARLGAGNSMSFAPDASKAWGDGLSAIGLPQSTGFTLEVFPKGDAGGVLVNLGQGGQRLSYSNMRFTYSVRTEEGDFAVTSEPIFPARWHQVSARYHQGKLQLSVNDQHYETAASGVVEYHWTGNSSGNDEPGINHDLEIAGEFNGYLDNLKWFNWASSPLMTFSDGTTQTTVTLTAQTETLILNSTGKLHEPGAQTTLHRVAVYTDKVHQYASLISLDAYKTIAGMHSEATPLDQQTVALPLNFLFPQAHAGFWGGVMNVVSFFLPVQELGIVLQQLSYAVTDPDKFEGDTFIVNLIIAATYFPPGRVLQPFAKSLGILFKTLKGINPNFLKYFGGMFSGVISRAKKGQFDILWHMIPFFIVMAEMYNDEEARKGLEFMFKTVDSGEDILSWVEYLALPAEGWSGDGVPEVGMLLNDTEQSLPLNWMMNQAYAQGKLKRISGVVAGKFLKEASKRLSKNSANVLPDALKIIAKEIKHLDAAAMRKYLFSPSMWVAASGVVLRRDANGLKVFLRGKSNARYKPVTVLATVAYVEWEAYCGKLLDGDTEDLQGVDAQAELADKECGQYGLQGERNREQLTRLYERFLADSLNGKYDEETDSDEDISYLIYPSGHGALYHYNQIAYHLLLQRGGGDKLKEIEGSRWVWLYENKDQKRIHGAKFDRKDADEAGIPLYNRNVDIVLEGSDGKEKWVELKSYSALEHTGDKRKKLATLKGKSIGQWNAKGKASGNVSLHKQFLLDRAAATEGKVRWKDPEDSQYKMVDVTSSFKWRFQKFKVSIPNSTKIEADPLFGNINEKDTIYYSMNQLAKQDKAYTDLNWGTGNFSSKEHVEHASLQKFLGLLTQIGFKEAADALLEEPAEALGD